MGIQIKEFKFNIGNEEVFMAKELLEWDFEGELSSQGRPGTGLPAESGCWSMEYKVGYRSKLNTRS